MSFRRIILTEVKRRGLSGYALAKLSGLAIRTVQNYLNGAKDMTGEKLSKLAETLCLELRPIGDGTKRRAARSRARGKDR